MLCGFSRTGFMCTDGGTRAARACSAWARPISPPSAVTAALLDMFCGFNGATFRPRRVSARASPATTSDLPTSEPVPWNMMARATMGLELDAFLRLHAGREVMLDEIHLGDEIRGLDQLGLGIAAGDDDVQIGPSRLQGRDDIHDRQMIVAQRDVELV